MILKFFFRTAITISFSLLISYQAFSQIVNDSCATAELKSFVDGMASISVDLSEAMPSGVTSSCESNSFKDAWYSFVAPISGNLFIDGPSFSKYAIYEEGTTGCLGAEVACITRNNFVFNLESGKTYRLQTYFTLGEGVLEADLMITDTISNNICAEAEPVVFDVENTAAISFDSKGANYETSLGSCTTDETHRDAWYSFDAPVSGNLFIDGPSFSRYVIYEAGTTGCLGAELACITQDNFVFGLESGKSYMLQTYLTLGVGTLSANLKFTETITNDICAEAEPVVFDVENTAVISFDTKGANYEISLGSCTTNDTHRDAWYSFDAPVSGNLFIDGPSFSKYVIYEVGTTGCLGAELACITQDNFVFNLESGESYILQTYLTLGVGALSANLKFTETITNDICTEAEPVVFDMENKATVGFDTKGANNETSLGSCTENETLRDGWYSFTAPVSGNLFIDGPSFSRYVVYESDTMGCIGSEVACINKDNFVYGIVQGKEYKLQAYLTLGVGKLDFTLEAIEAVPNDICTDALPLFFNDENKVSVAFNTKGANLSTDSIDCREAKYRDGWYSFEAPVTGNLYIDGPSFGGYTLFKAGSSACDDEPLVCLNNDGIFYDLIAGQRYLLQTFLTLGVGEINFSMTSFARISNDKCESAAPLPVTLDLKGAIKLQPLGATLTDTALSCTNEPVRDGWYRFTSPISATASMSGSSFGVYNLYEKGTSSCAGVTVNCLGGNGTLGTLEKGKSYLLQVSRSLGVGEINTTMSIEGTISPEELDSIALVTIYNKLDGENWTNQTNWLEDGKPISEWSGIQVNGQNKVTSIDLSDRNLGGRFPAIINGALSSLTALKLSNNLITGFEGAVPVSLTSVDVSFNKLEFGAIETLLTLVETVTYNDQQPQGTSRSLTAELGKPFVISVDVTGDNNLYQWYKDGLKIENENNKSINFDSIRKEDQARYTCEITNTVVTGLKITSLEQTLLARASIRGKIFTQTGIPVSKADVLLFIIKPRGGYDTLAISRSRVTGFYQFENLSPDKTYTIQVVGDTLRFIGSYLGDVFAFQRASSIILKQSFDDVNIKVKALPSFLRNGKKRIKGILERESDDITTGGSARVQARRRVSLAGVSLYKSKTRLRVSEPDPEEWDLVAYAQTDENGQFAFESLPDGYYRIEIDFPGIPLAENSVVEFDLRSNEEGALNTVELEAVIDDDGIVVETIEEEPTGEEVITDAIDDLMDEIMISPNPSSGIFTLSVKQQKINAIKVSVSELSGGILMEDQYFLDESQKVLIDLTNLSPGIYILVIRHLDGAVLSSLRILKR